MIRMVLVTVLLLGGCGGGGEPPPDEGVFDDLTGTLDRAGQVEEQVLEQKKRLDEALAEAEQADGGPDERDP